MFDAAIRTGADQWQMQHERPGGLAHLIAERTAKLPPEAYLWAALGSVGVAMTLRLAGKTIESEFVGRWAATFLVFGLYNKLTRAGGHKSVRQ